MDNKIVVGIGEILWDMFPGRKVMGGATANFAYHISQFGYNGHAVSAVGDDPLGREITSTLRKNGLSYLLETVDYPTGTVEVSVDDRGVPSYRITENVAWDNIPFDVYAEKLASRTSTVCFGTLAQRSAVSRETIRRFIWAMPPDSLRIFDINLRQHFYSKQVIVESMGLANIMKINDEELAVVAGLFGLEGDDETKCMRLMEDHDLEILMLTKGTEGSFVFTPSEVSFLETPTVQVEDTVGAGDAFTAAFTAAHMYGESIRDAHRLAVEVSAYVCRRRGAMTPLPDHLGKIFDR